ncbi:hypothetical protein ACQCSX_18800 [Pseudarthrobacter sp. P1]|uniref:hypothetical protein n=1 Tax=Pseudarthrobacter sp. P1 TaxID=3418418 RepID=UPI003CE9DC2B
MAEWAADTALGQLATPGIGTPHATTLGRALERLDADLLDRLAGAWAQAATTVTAGASDGKEVRGAKNGGGAQQNIAEKHNEITHFKPLMDGIKNLKCVTITADALHSQREHAHYLHGRGAHYVRSAEANQPKKLHDQLRSLPWNRVRAGHKPQGSGHGLVAGLEVR